MDLTTITISILSSSAVTTMISLYFNQRSAKQLISLERESKRREILLTKLREEQADVFKALYQKLIEMYAEMWSATSPPRSTDYFSAEQPEDETEFLEKVKSVSFSTKAEAFWSFFQSNRIFFPKALCEKIEHFHIQVGTTFQQLRLDKDDREREERITRYSAWQQLHAIKDDIEKNFRVIMGVEDFSPISKGMEKL